ncbi:PPOX class F420-dependent oxidoreductase [Myxococcota bacterium]|nr:PPOX class F420-dependent oxidoreductase [Myxococcota bacterium]
MAQAYSEIPASHMDILEGKCFPHVATMRPDGMMSNHPVCLIWDGEHIRFSITKSRKKYRNLRFDDRISLSIPDPSNIWRYLEIRGRATLEDDTDRSFINSIAVKYMGQDDYPFDGPADERVTVTVHVEQVSAAAVHSDVNDGQAPDDWTR